MSDACNKILLAGLPGCGKTTTVMQIVNSLRGKSIAGFYTQEIRKANRRKGFTWNRLDGASGILAHVDLAGPYKVGKYGVDVQGFEDSVVKYLDPDSGADIFVIDEIGRMECFSERFVRAVQGLFSSDKAVLATVAQKGSGFISEVKRRPNTKLFNLTRSNHNEVVAKILEMLSLETETQK